MAILGLIANSLSSPQKERKKERKTERRQAGRKEPSQEGRNAATKDGRKKSISSREIRIRGMIYGLSKGCWCLPDIRP